MIFHNKLNIELDFSKLLIFKEVAQNTFIKVFILFGRVPRAGLSAISFIPLSLHKSIPPQSLTHRVS